MHLNKINLAKKTLKLLEKSLLENISLKSIIKNNENLKIYNKSELLININKYVDYQLKENLYSIESSSKKDMLFEVIMARLDILNINRRSFKNIIKYLLSRPKDLIKLLPSFVESMILIATMSNININGIKGMSKVKVILILYILIIFIWNQDESESLEKTMTTLDKYLINLENISKLF